MPTYQVRNKRTKIVLGDVVVDDPTKVLDGLKEATGCSIDEIALSLGSTVEEAKSALDIVEMKEPTDLGMIKKVGFPTMRPRRLFA